MTTQHHLGPHYIVGSARAIPLADGSVNMACGSPPYFGLRWYGDNAEEPGRRGLETYIEEMVEAAKEVKRVLDKRGLFFFNLGDTAANSGGAGGDHVNGSKKSINYYKQGDMGIKGNQWGMVPWRVAMAFQQDGWLLRNTIIWNKMKLKPESVRHTRRPGLQWEPIFMFAKHPSYRYYPEGTIEPGNIWHFQTSRGKNHQAPFPDELPRRCIAIGSTEGDTVIDPWSGSGTTARVAASLGRRGIGIELYPDVAADAASREEPIRFTSQPRSNP